MPDSFYQTSDVYLAAYLLSWGAVLTGCQRVGKRRNVFTFKADEQLHAWLRVYWIHAPMDIVPLQLFDCLRRLKSISRLRPKAGGRRARLSGHRSGRPIDDGNVNQPIGANEVPSAPQPAPGSIAVDAPLPS